VYDAIARGEPLEVTVVAPAATPEQGAAADQVPADASSTESSADA
jgi:hypothetical protein